MRSFTDVSETIRETALVISAGATFAFLLIIGVTLPTIIRRGYMLNPSFLAGFILFGALGFFAFDVIRRLEFIGPSIKYGVAGFIILILLGAVFGGDNILALVSGSISGVTLFYVKSIYAIYYIYRTETHETSESLRVSELEPLGELNHYGIDGLGSNFEVLNYLIESLSDGSEVLYYARHNQEEPLLGQLLRETILFYANHLSPLHKVKTRDKSKVIKQIAIEASYLDTMERALFNYWARAYLTGGYTSVIVPFDDDFVEKAAICERSYGADLEIDKILGDSGFLMLLHPLSPKENMIEVYTRWTLGEFRDRVEVIHPVSQSDSEISL